MQQNPDQNLNPVNQNPANPQNPQVNPSNQTFINTAPAPTSTVPVNNATQGTQKTIKKIDSVEKIIQVIWFIVGFINVILALRIIFLLFNAQSSGFRGFLYSVTAPFAAPFNGIFPVPRQVATYFDSASVVAIIIYSLAVWGIVTLIRIVANRENPTQA